MPKRKRPEEDPKKQFERFVEAAREHGVTNDAEIEERFKRLSRKSQKAHRCADSDDGKTS